MELIMKKALFLILALLICLSLCACGGGSTTNSTLDTNNSDTTPVVNSGDNSSTTDTSEEAHVMTEEEIFAAKILIEGVKRFENPLSTKVKNAWVYKMSIGYCYFTFELEVKNSVGIVESVYYGNSTFFKDLSDATLSDALSEMKSCNTLTALGSATSSMYFRENKIDAMQSGTPMHAGSIQDYFLKNYK